MRLKLPERNPTGPGHRRPAPFSMYTPWGWTRDVMEITEGVWRVWTPSHGGLKLSRERWDELPRAVRGTLITPRFAEEDCEEPVVKTVLDIGDDRDREMAWEIVECFERYAPALPFVHCYPPGLHQHVFFYWGGLGSDPFGRFDNRDQAELFANDAEMVRRYGRMEAIDCTGTRPLCLPKGEMRGVRGGTSERGMSREQHRAHRRTGAVPQGGPGFRLTGEEKMEPYRYLTDLLPSAQADRQKVYSRPAAEYVVEGYLVVRASAAGGCRRALWYAATRQPPTDQTPDEALTVMEAGTALEPVVLQAMRRAGWEIAESDPSAPQPVSVEIDRNLLVVGHPDAVGSSPLFGDEMVVEVKTRGPSAYSRWKHLGVERSHPESVAQLALYTYGLFGQARDGVIATMDTGSRQWDYETVPADRIARTFEAVKTRLGELSAHDGRHRTKPDVLPDRDFHADSWQCQRCPYLSVCLPGDAVSTGDEEMEEQVARAEAEEAVRAYTEAQAETRGPDRAKREALSTLKTWMRQQDLSKTALAGRKVSLVQSKRYSVDYRRLNETLGPEIRAEIVREQDSEYVRVA